MGTFLVKSPKKKSTVKANSTVKEEAVVKMIEKEAFLSRVERIVPTHVKGYVCLF